MPNSTVIVIIPSLSLQAQKLALEVGTSLHLPDQGFGESIWRTAVPQII